MSATQNSAQQLRRSRDVSGGLPRSFGNGPTSLVGSPSVYAFSYTTKKTFIKNRKHECIELFETVDPGVGRRRDEGQTRDSRVSPFWPWSRDAQRPSIPHFGWNLRARRRHPSEKSQQVIPKLRAYTPNLYSDLKLGTWLEFVNTALRRDFSNERHWDVALSALCPLFGRATLRLLASPVWESALVCNGTSVEAAERLSLLFAEKQKLNLSDMNFYRTYSFVSLNIKILFGCVLWGIVCKYGWF